MSDCKTTQATPFSPRPTEEQRRWLQLGISEPGGKLPITNHEGRRISDTMIDECLNNGWVAQWIHNPLKPKTRVCHLTEEGKSAIASAPIIKVDFSKWKHDDSQGLSAEAQTRGYAKNS